MAAELERTAVVECDLCDRTFGSDRAVARHRVHAHGEYSDTFEARQQRARDARAAGEPLEDDEELLGPLPQEMGDWVERGACRDMELDIFFPPTGEKLTGQRRSVVLADDRPALAVCDLCEVRAECAEWGVAHEEYGIWGGLTAIQRTLLRRSGSIQRVVVADPVTARARRLVAKGWDLVEVAVELGLPSEAAVARLLEEGRESA